MTALVLGLYVLAVARLTRLVNADTILDPPRLAIARRGQDDDRSDRERARWNTALYFVQCPWCVGLWLSVAAAPAPIVMLGWSWWALVPLGLACSHLVGVFAFAADTEEVSIE